jgi:AraC-like DNA-binding protein
MTLFPYQPDITAKCKDLYNSIDVWNPHSIKNKVLISQFSTGPEPVTLELVPDNCAQFMFVLNKTNPRAFLVGPVDSLVLKEIEPNSVFFTFKPYSLSGTVLSKLGLNELKGLSVPLNVLFKSDEVVERIHQAEHFNERVSIFKDFALKTIIKPDKTHPFVEQLQLMICDSRGTYKIRDLADKMGFSPRYCLNKFRDALGVTLKNYSEIIRFQSVIIRLTVDKRNNFSDLVYDNNFFDQSHMINMFKRYTFRSPTKYLRTLDMKLLSPTP